METTKDIPDDAPDNDVVRRKRLEALEKLSRRAAAGQFDATFRVYEARKRALREAASDLASWQETSYLLRSPANAERLMAAVTRDQAGHPGVVRTVEELEALANPSL
ncbi:hypothetical protein [Kitasatospora sp. NPDC056531]|uniref:hypothetical protein n=1 Tax=Kitasatospora sp. NPDC056531 TaxID=3345856 RepID=UPI0036A41EFD